MSGACRKSHYRKHLTDQVLNDFPEPDIEQNEEIARIAASRGGNTLEITLPNDAKVELALLPSKFNKLVWVKRGDYIIVQSAADDNTENTITTSTTGAGIRYLVKHVLYKEQVKFLRSMPYWPSDFNDDSATAEGISTSNNTAITAEEEANRNKQDEMINSREIIMSTNNNNDPYGMYGDENEGGAEYDNNGDADADLFVNTNRVATIRVDDSSDSSDEE